MVPAILLKTIPGLKTKMTCSTFYCQAREREREISHDRVIPVVHVMHSFALIKLKHHQHCRIKITPFLSLDLSFSSILLMWASWVKCVNNFVSTMSSPWLWLYLEKQQQQRKVIWNKHEMVFPIENLTNGHSPIHAYIYIY